MHPIYFINHSALCEDVNNKYDGKKASASIAGGYTLVIETDEVEIEDDGSMTIIGDVYIYDKNKKEVYHHDVSNENAWKKIEAGEPKIYELPPPPKGIPGGDELWIKIIYSGKSLRFKSSWDGDNYFNVKYPPEPKPKKKIKLDNVRIKKSTDTSGKTKDTNSKKKPGG